jgi:hypothetical protein
LEVNIIVNNVWSRVSGLKDLELVDYLDKITSYYVHGYQYSKAFREGYYDKKREQFIQWDGKKHLLTQKMVFPTGLLERIRIYLEERNVKVNIIDQREPVVLGERLPIINYTPRPYQIEALSVATSYGRGIIRMSTGSGKTLLAAMMLAEYNVPSMIYVIGKDLLYQFHREMQKSLGKKIGLIGDGHYDVKKISVCSIWTAATAFGVKSNVSLDDEDWCP